MLMFMHVLLSSPSLESNFPKISILFFHGGDGFLSPTLETVALAQYKTNADGKNTITANLGDPVIEN